LLDAAIVDGLGNSCVDPTFTEAPLDTTGETILNAVGVTSFGKLIVSSAKQAC